MNTKRKLLLSSIVLIGALLLSAFATASTSQADEGQGTVVGTWNVTHVSQAGGPTGLALTTYNQDGTLTEAENSPGVGPGHGVWARKGHIFATTFESFAFDQNGNWLGRARVRIATTLNDEDHISGKFAVDLIDPDGHVTVNADHGTFTGTRMKLGAVP